MVAMNNKIGIQYGYWAKERNVDFLSYVPRVAKLGFDVLGCGVGPLLTYLTADQRNALKNAVLDAGLEFNLQAGCRKDCNIAAADAEVRSKGIEHLKQQIQAARDLGGKVLGGMLHCAFFDVNPEKDRRYHLDNSVECMKEVVKFAEDLGILLNVEVVNRFESFLLTTAEQGLEYVRMVGSPNLKVELDTFHMNIEEDNIGQAILKVGENLGSLHVCENNRKLPGKGHIPWNEVANAIRQINYQGYISIESFVMADCPYGREFKIWRNMEDRDLDVAAKESLEFLRATLK
jgi:D-psicose/D-tagatose/L-ribulose 3-epimerase